MNCLEFQACLEDQFDPSAPFDHAALFDSAELRAHRSECEGCRQIWDQLRLLDEAIVVWREATPDCELATAVISRLSDAMVDDAVRPSVSDGIPGRRLGQPVGLRSDRVVTGTRVQQSHHGRMWHGRMWHGRMWAAMLAGLAGAVALYLFIPAFRPGAPHDPAPVLQGSIQGHASPDALDAGSGSNLEMATSRKNERAVTAEGVEVRALVEEAGMAYLELAESTASVFRDAAELLPPAASPSVDVELPVSDGASSTEWMGGLENGLKPIGESVSQAFDFLWRTETERAEG